jgi:hypothetical protein
MGNDVGPDEPVRPDDAALDEAEEPGPTPEGDVPLDAPDADWLDQQREEPLDDEAQEPRS